MITVLSLLLVHPSHAFSTGVTGVSVAGCIGGGCHGDPASAQTTARFSGSTTVSPGSTVSMSFVVTNLFKSAGGFNVSTTGGTLNAGSNNWKSGSELTHTSPVALSAGSATFDFTWTAPTTPGTYTLRGAGNAVNGNGTTFGDAWNRTTVDITVEGTCVDADADGYTDCDGDCDEGDPSVYPGAPSVCDGLDNDCDGVIEAEEFDQDSDGYAACDGDCDDGDASVYPGAAAYCDGIPDTDCDGFMEAEEADQDADGVTECSGDCDDLDAAVYPGAGDVCEDGLDADCDGTDPTCAPACSVTLMVPTDGADLTAEGRFVYDGDCDGYWVELSPSASFPAYDTIYNARLSDSAGPQSLVFPASAWPNISRRFVNGGYARVLGGALGETVSSNVVSFDVSGVPSSFPTPVASCSVSLVEPANGAAISGEPTFRWSSTCTAGRLEFSDDPTFPIESTVVLGAFSGTRATLNASRWALVTSEFRFGGYWRVVAGSTAGEHVSDTFSWTVP